MALDVLASDAEADTRAPVQLATRICPPPAPLPPPMYSTVPSALATLLGAPAKSRSATVESGGEPSPAMRTMVRAAAAMPPALALISAS